MVRAAFVHFTVDVCSILIFNSSYLFQVLPVLALYLYIARTVCRDLHLTVTCRILKVWMMLLYILVNLFFSECVCLFESIELPLSLCVCIQVKVLTELGAFTEAFKELSSLTFGKEIPVPHGCHRTEKPFWVKQHKQYKIPSWQKIYMQLSFFFL